MKLSLSLQVVLALAGLTGSSSIWSMDKRLSLQNILQQTFEITDEQIAQTRFYQAICDGNIDLVRDMVKNRRINPHHMLTWHSFFILYLGGQDEKTSQNYNGCIGYIPVTHHLVLESTEKFKDLQQVAQKFLPLTIAIIWNKADIVKFFVEECKVNVDTINEYNTTALHTTLDQYNTDLVQYLLDHGANPLYKKNSVHHHTVLESINYELSIPQEMGAGAIAKLQQIKPIVEQALAKNRYQDPYSNLDHFHPESIWAKTFKLTQQQINDTRFFQAIIAGNMDLITELVNSKKINPQETIHPVIIQWVTKGTLIQQPISSEQFLNNPIKMKNMIDKQAPDTMLGPMSIDPENVYEFIPSEKKDAIVCFLQSSYDDDQQSYDTDESNQETSEDSDESKDDQESSEDPPPLSSRSSTASTDQIPSSGAAQRHLSSSTKSNAGNLTSSTATDQPIQTLQNNLTDNGQQNMLLSPRRVIISALGIATVLFGIKKLYAWCMRSNTADEEESDSTDEHTTGPDTEKNLNVTQ